MQIFSSCLIVGIVQVPSPVRIRAGRGEMIFRAATQRSSQPLIWLVCLRQNEANRLSEQLSEGMLS